MKRDSRRKDVHRQKYQRLQGLRTQQLPGMTKVQPKRAGAWEGRAGGQAGQVRSSLKMHTVKKFALYFVGN